MEITKKQNRKAPALVGVERRAEKLLALPFPEREAAAMDSLKKFDALRRRTVAEAWLAGRLLESVKADLQHGQFRGWLQERGIKKDMAARLMKLGRELEISQIANFESVSAALKSLAAPPEKPAPRERKSRVENARGYIQKISELGELVAAAAGGFELSPQERKGLIMKALNLHDRIARGKAKDVSEWTEKEIRAFMGMPEKGGR